MTSTCTKHRMIQISYEAIYPFNWSLVPTKEIYSYKCMACGHTHQLITIPKSTN